jgi:hypothetical protein
VTVITRSLDLGAVDPVLVYEGSHFMGRYQAAEVNNRVCREKQTCSAPDHAID